MESASVSVGHHEEHHGPPEANQSSRIGAGAPGKRVAWGVEGGGPAAPPFGHFGGIGQISRRATSGPIPALTATEPRIC